MDSKLNDCKPAHMSDTTPAGEACAPRTSWRGVARRAILCATCAATAATLMFPSASFAAEWVNVDGTEYTEAHGTAEDSWSWDGADDMRLNGYEGGSISAAGRLDVTYAGENTVTNEDGPGILVEDGEDEKAELNVTGGEGDSLTVESENTAIACDGEISISGNGTVSASSESGHGIGATGNVSIEDASVEAKGDLGIFSADSTTIKNSEVTVEGSKAGIYGRDSVAIDSSTVKASVSQEGGAIDNAAFGIASFQGDITIKNGSLVEALAKSDVSAVGIYSVGAGEAGGGHIAISDSTVTAAGEIEDPTVGTGVGIWAATNADSPTPASIVISRSNVSSTGTDVAFTSAAYGDAGDDLEPGTITIKDSSLTAPQDAELAEYEVTLRSGRIAHGTTFVVSDLNPEGGIGDIETLEDISIRKVAIEADEKSTPETTPTPEVKPASAVTPAGSVTKKVIPQTGDASPVGLVASAIAGASALAAGIFMTRNRES